jgi:hypothetical protein
MTIIILYVLAVLTFFSWAFGWILWHSYLALSRFSMAHHHKRPAATHAIPRPRGEVLPLGDGHEVFKMAHFHAGKSNRANLSL